MLLVEQISCNVLSRWFIGLPWTIRAGTFDLFDESARPGSNRRYHDIPCQITNRSRERQLLSDEHFRVGGTLIYAWASLKSFQPKDEPAQAHNGRNDECNFH